MVFSEVYSKYFSVVASILKEAGKSPITEKRIQEIVSNDGFTESVLTIPTALKKGKWPLLNQEGKSLLHKEPHTPLTLLQKRWLKSLLLDPRISLFLEHESKQSLKAGHSIMEELADVPPLFTPQMFVFFDQYLDGDPYEEAAYQEHFHMIVTALKQKRMIQIRYRSNKGKERTERYMVSNIEYSLKDDKFRMIGASTQYPMITINISTILECKYSDKVEDNSFEKPAYKKRQLELMLTDQRNALERAMLHFSHFEKVTEKMDDTHYRFLIQYETEDETELLIRVLSFGPLIKVVAPEAFINQIKNRLYKQKSYEL